MASKMRYTAKKVESVRPVPTGGKLSVAKPASVKKFLLILLMYVCKKVLLLDTRWRMGIYLACVTIGSLLTDLFPFPRSYFSQRGNFFNQYMVKLGWGWTFALLLAFVVVTSYTYCCGEPRRVGRHLARLLVGTFVWYVCTTSFEYVENVTGLCESDSAAHWDKRSCHKSGFKWIGFDISGHAFLLIHCLLTISSEARCVKDWERIRGVIQSEDRKETARLDPAQLARLKTCFDRWTPIVRLMMVALVLLTVVWEMMLLATIMYFHNLPQKLAACGFASGAWFITYGCWYRMKDFSPGLPGDGPFKYII